MTGVHSSGKPAKQIIEDKVKASTAGTAVATFLLTALANGAQDGTHGVLLRGLNEWADTILSTVISAAVAFVSGWAAKHTHRPDLQSPPAMNL